MDNDGDGPTADAASDSDGRVLSMAEPSPSRAVDPAEVCVLIPTLDEEATIGAVVDGFAEYGYTNALIIDGNSSDETRAVAREHGARVLTQSGSGKGQAVREALRHIEVPYVLMVDGDQTYNPADAEAMLEPLAAGYDHVIGDRFARMEPGAMTRLNRVGNRLINRSFRVIHGAAYGDILSGYRAFTTESVARLSLQADGFTIETELAVECVKHGVQTAVVPISYRPRPAESDTNLNPIADGGRIIFTLYSLAKTNNPLFYFGSLGIGAILAGSAIASYVLARWVRYEVGHEVLAVAAAAGIILGVQLLMFGVLSDMIVTLHREQQRRLEQVTHRQSREKGERASSRADSETHSKPRSERK